MVIRFRTVLKINWLKLVTREFMQVVTRFVLWILKTTEFNSLAADNSLIFNI